jgi:hypothetical protein
MVSTKNNAASQWGRITLFSLFFLILFACLATPCLANSLEFSGLGKTNKTIEVYQIVDGQVSFVQTINSSEKIYTVPGSSYIMVIKPVNNTTFMSTPTGFVTFLTDNGYAILAFLFFILALVVIASIFLIGRH